MRKLKLFFLKRKYRKLNKHNYTTINSLIDINKIKIGKATYGKINILTYGGMNGNLEIGNYCSIANETVFLLGGEHSYNRVSTYPFKAKYMNEKEGNSNGDIKICDDVWIGYGVTILSGVTIRSRRYNRSKECCSKGRSAICYLLWKQNSKI